MVRTGRAASAPDVDFERRQVILLLENDVKVDSFAIVVRLEGVDVQLQTAVVLEVDDLAGGVFVWRFAAVVLAVVRVGWHVRQRREEEKKRHSKEAVDSRFSRGPSFFRALCSFTQVLHPSLSFTLTQITCAPFAYQCVSERKTQNGRVSNGVPAVVLAARSRRAASRSDRLDR